MGTLFIVSTPIGNLGDITLRALEALKLVELVLCEDTRKTQKLLSHYKIHKKLESFHEHNETIKINWVVETLKQGTNIALVSDAGTPLISDPGFKLIRECVRQDLKVEAIPGASSVLTALVASGLPTNQFLFLGYLPKKKGKLDETLSLIEEVNKLSVTTIVMFESPYRIKKTLELLAIRFPEKDLVIAREMSKLHEEFLRGKAKQLAKQPLTTKGEFTLVLN